MPLPPSDRALRRLVAEVAGAAPEDLQAILDELEPAQRERVLQLLRGYAGAPDAGAMTAGSATLRRVVDGASPWLAARLEAAGAPARTAPRRPGGPGSPPLTTAVVDFAMTPHALEALRRAATALPQLSDAPSSPEHRDGLSLIGRLRKLGASAP